jgi:hypothetical protein
MRTSIVLPVLALCGFTAPTQAGRLVAVDSDRRLYEISPATGAKTRIGQVSANAGVTAGLARDRVTGTIYVTSTSPKILSTLDLATGDATVVGTYGPPFLHMHGLEWDGSSGRLYGAAEGNLHVLDTTTGVATQVGTSGLTSFTNLVHDSDNDVLHATNAVTDGFYSVDRATGAMTWIGALLGPVEIQGLAYDDEQRILYAIDNVLDNLYRIDPATGVATLVGPTGEGNLLGLVFAPDPIVATSFCAGDGSAAACPCGNAGAAGNGCANSIHAAGALLSGSGIFSISHDTFVLTGTSMPDSSALFFQGTSRLNGGLGTAFGDGLRCVSGTILRLGTKLNAGGSSSYPASGDVPISIQGANQVGARRTYQVWYRNAAAFCSPATFNLTNGLALQWLP